MARVPYPEDSSLDPRALRALEQVPVRINLFSMLANAPALIGPVLRLGGAILGKMELDPKLRELAILRVAAVTQTPYEWHHHEPMGRQAGLDAATVEAVSSIGGPGAEFPLGLDGVSSLVVRLVDETIATTTPSAAIVAELQEEIGSTQLVELICTVGYYCMIGQLVRTLDVDIDDAPAIDGGTSIGT